ncbi:MAG: hypothetical protein HY291_06685 [Planctomycetes bacterium]|nr:hypothetical protein [Planctomycetota bacterium]
MLKTVEGQYKNGKVVLVEKPKGVREARVIVTFLDGKNRVRLDRRGIGKEQAASLRHRLKACAEDWSRPEMDAYDEV